MIKNSPTKLNLEQEAFCQIYATSEEFFCNGVQSYIEAYKVDMTKPSAYKSAMASSCRLLTNDKILKRIDKIIELKGLNDSYVDKQLEKLVTQDADFKTKLGAIKEYNNLKSRIEKKIKVESETLEELLREMRGK